MPRKQKRSPLLALYENLDEQWLKWEKRANVTCSRGCNACCENLVFMTLHCAQPIAEVLLDRTNWRQIVERLRAQSEVECEYLTAPDYRDRHIMCALNDVRGECSVYDVRPGPCRYYSVASDPKHCSVNGDTVSILKPNEGVALVTRFLAKASKTAPVPLPLATAVLVAMSLMCKRQRQGRAIRQAAAHIPEERWWWEKWRTTDVSGPEQRAAANRAWALTENCNP